MANIWSEVSRSLKNQSKPHRFKASYNRAIELFDLSIAGCKSDAQRKEIKIAKFEFCDYFENKTLNTDPSKMQKYYDQFASITYGKLKPGKDVCKYGKQWVVTVKAMEREYSKMP